MPAIRKQKADLLAIGLRIRKLRGDMLQQDLARFLAISQGQLSKMERGKIGPTADILVRLADKFNIPIDWIVRGDPGE